jgi:hypothetical protein
VHFTPVCTFIYKHIHSSSRSLLAAQKGAKEKLKFSLFYYRVAITQALNESVVNTQVQRVYDFYDNRIVLFYRLCSALHQKRLSDGF